MRSYLAVVIGSLLSVASATAWAQSESVDPGPVQQPPIVADGNKPGAAKSSDDWRFAATIYGWATNLSGSASARGNTVDINASVIDLIQKSDSLLAWDSYFEANKGRFGLYGDVVWAKLGIPASAAAYRNPIAGVRLSLTANAAITTSLLILEGGAVYEANKWTWSEQSFTAFDILAGARYWNSTTDVALDLTGAISFSDPRLAVFDRSKTIGIADSGTLQWTDPLIGFRFRHQITPSQNVMFRADVGGFGIPGSSLFSWQVAGIYSYTWHFTGYSLSAVGGYRALSVYKTFDSATGGDLNLIVHGPMIGLTVSF